MCGKVEDPKCKSMRERFLELLGEALDKTLNGQSRQPDEQEKPIYIN